MNDAPRSIEVSETQRSEMENYKEIRPDVEMSPSEARDYFDKLFSKPIEDDRENKSSQEEGDRPASVEQWKDTGIARETLEEMREKVSESISTREGLESLMEKHPEKAGLWEKELKALHVLNDSNASPLERRSAQGQLSILKGQLMETAVKDVLSEAGFEVEARQRVLQGESGGTRPDVIARNGQDRALNAFGKEIPPGETVSVECKCGASAYMTNQLNNHIPNQLSGQEGTKVLAATGDIRSAPEGLADKVCDKYDAMLVVVDTRVADMEKALKEVAGI